MLGQLLPCAGGEAIPLWDTTLVVGRAKECHLRLKSEHISAKHCLLEMRDSFWYVVDLQSKNGVKVGGKRCINQQLNPKDVLSIGPFRFQIMYYPQGDEPSPTITSEEALELEASHPLGGCLGELIPQAGGKPIPLLAEHLIVGRAAECDIRLDYETISSRHCELWWEAGQWNVRDLGSRNGIKVDGSRCRNHVLRPGDVLSIARFRFRIEYVHKGKVPEIKRGGDGPDRKDTLPPTSVVQPEP